MVFFHNLGDKKKYPTNVLTMGPKMNMEKEKATSPENME